jgi:arylsulfatase A-like enzyme
MSRSIPGCVCVATLCAAGLMYASGQNPPLPRRNVLIFVADGLRHGSVNEQDTPALWSIRTEGVHFENSHALFPTFTMANASAIATGRGLGDTGVYSNVIWAGFPTFDTGNFNLLPDTPVPFIENDRILADLDDHFGGNMLGSETLLAMARAHGYRTAAIGKLGPTALQDVAAISPALHSFPHPMPAIIVDDATGSAAGPPWPPDIEREVLAAGVPPAAPTRSNGYSPTSRYNNGYNGDLTEPGTLAANVTQAEWFADVTTRIILPSLAKDPATPFAMLFWSRDPDGTQHNQGDSLGTLFPGINGATSRRGVRNADRALQRLMAWFDAHPDVKANTDIVVTSDHGFATISRSEIDRTGRLTVSESARHDYVGAEGNIDTLEGTLPFGFLALDLAYDLRLNIFDPDRHAPGSRLYKKLRVGSASAALPLATWEHPIAGNGFIGSDVQRPDGADARIIVAANGGSDLIYVPDSNPDTVRQVVSRLLTYDYVSGVFVDDRYGEVAGTLPLSAINLGGSSKVPRPSIVVGFKVFHLDPADLQTGIQISDASLREGQGMHGGFGRESTYNNMAAVGPDFKKRFVDSAPAGNADIVPTLAHIMGFDLAKGPPPAGRVLTEALAGRPSAAAGPVRYLRSAAADGNQTVIVYQEHGGIRYLDMGCFAKAALRDADVCR